MPRGFEELDTKMNNYFGFLSNDYGYKALGSQGTSHAGHAYLKSYRKERLQISFVLYDWDLPEKHWNIFFQNDYSDEYPVYGRVEQSLFSLLESLGIDYKPHPGDFLSLGKTTIDDLLSEFASLLKQHGIPIIEGDYSIFPEQVYVLNKTWRPTLNLPPVRYVVGVYSDIEKVETAIEVTEKLDNQNNDYLEGFEVHRMQINQAPT